VKGLTEQAAAMTVRRFSAAALADSKRRDATKHAVLGKKIADSQATSGVRPPKLPQIKVTFVLDERMPLSESCAGGVVATSRDGLIVADNTLEKRLSIAASGLQPVLKQVVFPSSMPAEPVASAGEAHGHSAEADLFGV
jgi:hypothetical protein